jgi:hypothetical protein
MQTGINIKKTSLIIVLVVIISQVPISGSADIRKNYRDIMIDNFDSEKTIKDYFSYPTITCDMSDFIALNNNYFASTSAELPDKPEKESPLRRFEITFFISAPFVFIATFLTLHTYAVIRQKSTDINVWKDYKSALLIGTFGISSIVASREAWITIRENKKKDQTSDDRLFNFYATRNF